MCSLCINSYNFHKAAQTNMGDEIMDKKNVKSKFNKFIEKIGEAYCNTYVNYTDIHNYSGFNSKDISNYSTSEENKDLF